LASWTVSTYKPGCGIPALLSPSTSQFWQSDGPQPHLLNIHFFKLVQIVKLRVYLDFTLDESYTPTRMLFLAGMSMYDLTEFAEWVGEEPKGWVDVPLEGVGGGDDGNVLRAMVVQIRVCENHQNGKDTHVRGVQVFAMDERGPKGVRRRGVPPVMADEGGEEDIVMGDDELARPSRRPPSSRERKVAPTDAVEPTPMIDEATRQLLVVGLEEPDWMGEPELR
jgi:anaphase-promoting complex subunit 10